MQKPNNTSLNDLWNETRSGAWAGRGFHYQYLFSTLILIRQWAGLAPSGYLVPEGLEDCVIELEDRDIWLQIKSRKDNSFQKAEINHIFEAVRQKSSNVLGKNIQIVIGLENSCSDFKERSIDDLFLNIKENVIICHTPENEIIFLLTKHLNIAEIIAEGIANDLYKLIVTTSVANASLSLEEMRRISTSEIEHRIFERLEAEDPSAIDAALASRVIEPVDFTTPVSEPGFYQGVKTKPGHVAANLVLCRSDETNKIVICLKNKRHVLITGPSGAGKSSLMWLTAATLSGDYRWFQITLKAKTSEADSIIRFIRSRRPGNISPIGLAFDEIGDGNSDLWNTLVQELRSFPDVYLLGSVRREDKNLITNQSDTEFIEITLDESLAKSFWQQLEKKKQTNWSHWREPFEQSEGLMLEFIHILTQGKRLKSLIEDQIRQREMEKRHDELAIIRNTSVLCAHGGEVNANTLFDILDISQSQASLALKRLIDEHLVRESSPGVLGGLHPLRSQALLETSHDEIIYRSSDSFWISLKATTRKTLPPVIQSVFSVTRDDAEDESLRKISEILSDSCDIDIWVGILTGLGLSTLKRYIELFISILEKQGLQRAQWSLASMFAAAGIDIPKLSEVEQWTKIRNAVLEFRALPKDDLRAECLSLLPEIYQMPDCNNLKQVNKLLSCLVPIAGGEPIRIPFTPDFEGIEEQDINEVANLLSTAYQIGPDIAENFVNSFGGENVLFAWFKSQTPWVNPPTIDPKEIHGQTVRANWFHVAEDYQPDPHETICNVCETLIALCPNADAAASDAVDPSGQPITVGGFQPWSKNMPRENIPNKAMVSWNVAFQRTLLIRATENSLTEYTEQMVMLVKKTEKILRSFSEKWIKGKSISNRDGLTIEIDDLIQQINALTFSASQSPASSMTESPTDSGVGDTLGALLTGVLGNLIPRLGKIPVEPDARAAASFAYDLAAQAKEHEKSVIWRVTNKPPLKELVKLEKRLIDIAFILKEMANDETPESIIRIVKTAKKGRLGKAINSAARKCHSQAELRFSQKLHNLELELKRRGWAAKCWVRPLDEKDFIYWPPKEIAVLVEISDFETDAKYMEECLSVGGELLDQEWRFRLVPVVNGRIIPALALLPSSQMPLPDLNFEQEWQAHINLPFLSSEISNAFDIAVSACNQISAILYCCDMNNLHIKENDTLSKAIESYETSQKIVSDIAENSDQDVFVWAQNFLLNYWDQIVEEYELTKKDQKTETPLCMAAYYAMTGEENEDIVELASTRILLRQAECQL